MSSSLTKLFTMENIDNQNRMHAQRELFEITKYKKRARCFTLTNISNSERIHYLFVEIKSLVNMFIDFRESDYLKRLLEKYMELIYRDSSFEHIDHIDFEACLVLCRNICYEQIRETPKDSIKIRKYIEQIDMYLNELHHHEMEFVKTCMESQITYMDSNVDLYWYKSLENTLLIGRH